MFTEGFQHQINGVMAQKADDLLSIQRVAAAFYNERSGAMKASFSQSAQVRNGHLSLTYPAHVRILDLSRHLKSGKKRKNYQPLYNKFVYGNLYIGLYRRLSSGISGIIVSQFKSALSQNG